MIFDRFFSHERKPPGPGDDFWYGDYPQLTETGVRVSEDTAMRTSAVFACVRILSETIASLPLQVYRRLPNGEREIARDHPLYKILHSRPNLWQTSFEWREMIQGHLTLRGNAFNLLVPGDRGIVDQIVPLYPDRMRVDILDSGVPRYTYKTRDGKTEVYLQDEILHIRGLSGDGYLGLNPIQYQRESVGMAIATEEYGARFFKNSAKPQGVLKMPGTFKDDKDLLRFRKQWHESQAGTGQHRTAVLEGGMEYQAIGITNEDAQFLETRRYQVEEIARIFRIPPHMLQEMTRATFSNIEHQSLNFVVHTLRPWLVRWEQRLNESLLIAPERYFIEFTVDGLLRGDIKSRYEAYQSAINTGWMTRNEVRRKENLNSKPGLDASLRPLNMTDGKDERAAKLLADAAASLKRKELTAIRKNTRLIESGDFHDWAVSFYDGHRGTISKKLSVSTESAHIYCKLALSELLTAANSPTDPETSISDLLVNWEAESPGLLIDMTNEKETQHTF